MLVLLGCATAQGDSPRIGYRFNQPYGMGGGVHKGLDIDVPVGTPVRSIADGYVFMAEVRMYTGRIPTNVIQVNHDNHINSKYVHIDRMLVRPGDTVKQGQIIAYTALNGPAGFTGRVTTWPHLHLEVLLGNIQIDPESIGLSCTNSKYIYPVGCRQ